jgi:hypothetical protein
VLGLSPNLMAPRINAVPLKLGPAVMGDPLERGASPASERRLVLLGRNVPAQATAAAALRCRTTLPILDENHTQAFANNG